MRLEKCWKGNTLGSLGNYSVGGATCDLGALDPVTVELGDLLNQY